MARTKPVADESRGEGRPSGRFPLRVIAVGSRWHQAILEKKKAPGPCGPGAKLGSGRSPRALPRRTPWALSLSRAVCFPTPLRAAAHGYRSHGGTVLVLADWDFRVRSLRPDRSFPAGNGAPNEVLTRLQLTSFRVCTVLTGTAPAFGRALAPCYGSYLLTLRLHSALQLGDAVWRRRPNFRRFGGLCRARSLPASSLSLRALSRRIGPFGRWPRRTTLLRAGLRSSSRNPLGNCVDPRFETTRGPDSAWTRFLIHAWPHSS